MNLELGDTQLILKECEKYRLTHDQKAYVLATAYWETGRTMKPVIEAFWLSEEWRKKNLRYYPYYGRGYVQLTWDYNYRKAGEQLGVNFLANYDLLLEPKYAATILVRGMMEGWFTGKALPEYVNDEFVDFERARRVVNGNDKAETIAGIAHEYQRLDLSTPKKSFLQMILEILGMFK